MVGIVLASHGGLAQGAADSASMVFGALPNVACVSLTPQMGPDAFRASVLEAAEGLDDPSDILYLVDLWGGTPFNQISGLLDEHAGWALVTGLNLPLLIEALGARFDASLSAFEIATRLLAQAEGYVRGLPESLAPASDSTKAGLSSSDVPVLAEGDSPAQISWCRVDTRLLHGQVAMAWSKQVNPTRIVVVSDSVAHDELRKNLIVQAAPVGIKANVIPVAKLAQIADDKRLAGQRFMLLFETPQDVLRAIEMGVRLDDINIGSMAHSAVKTMLNDAISVDEDDVKTFERLRDAGCTFNVQKVPSNKSEDIWPLLAAKGLA